MALINWHSLEDLLVRACELEIRDFGQTQAEELFFAFCLEFDALDGTLRQSYGTRASVETALRQLQMELGPEAVCYRSVELQPENWTYRAVPFLDPEGYWSRAVPILDKYAEWMREDHEPEVSEFYWLRFEYLVECVIRRLVERDAFRYLPREPDFLAYCLCSEERLEELEDRLEKLYPNYRRATQEWVSQPQAGELLPGLCDGATCGRSVANPVLLRCTHCGDWYCESCRGEHRHPRLTHRQPFFD